MFIIIYIYPAFKKNSCFGNHMPADPVDTKNNKNKIFHIALKVSLRL